MSIKDVKFVDGLREQLKGLQPLPEDAGNPIYKLMQDKTLSGPALGKIVHALHEHRPMVKNGLDEDVPAPQKDTKILYDATPDRVSFSVVQREPQANGNYGILASTTLTRDKSGAWGLDTMFTSLDPTGFDAQEQRQYVDLAGGIRGAYKKDDQKFAADFLHHMTRGEDIWGALSNADHMGRIDNIFDAARKEEQERRKDGAGPVALFNIRDGRIPGTYDFSGGETKAERRTDTYPVSKPRR